MLNLLFLFLLLVLKSKLLSCNFRRAGDVNPLMRLQRPRAISYTTLLAETCIQNTKAFQCFAQFAS